MELLQEECPSICDLRGHGKGRSILDGVEPRVQVGNKIEGDVHRL